MGLRVAFRGNLLASIAIAGAFATLGAVTPVATGDDSALEPAPERPTGLVPVVEEDAGLAASPATTSPSAPPADEEPADTAESGAADGTSGAAAADTPALEPISAEEFASRLDVRVTSFLEIEPGATTEQTLLESWGPPAGKVAAGKGEVLTYHRPGFTKIDFAVEGGKVASIAIHMQQKFSVSEVVKQLDLTDVRPVPIPAETGELLGQAYPERGVVLGLDASEKSPVVEQILVERINSEPFTLRAEYDFEYQLGRRLVDLKYAVALNPKDARAHYLTARTLLEVGRYEEALAAASQAARLQPQVTAYRLMRARTLAAVGQETWAMKEAQAVRERPDTSALDQARSELVLGELTAGGQRDFKAAVSRFMTAIRLATPLAEDDRFAVRRQAKETLVEAHLATGLCIAAGDWQKKEEVCEKWFDRAESYVADLVDRDQGDPALKLKLIQHRLAARSSAPKMGGADAVIDDAIREGRGLIARSKDKTYQRRIEWMLGHTLAQAVRLANSRGEHDEALRYADMAVNLLESGAEGRHLSDAEEYRVGSFYFLVGSVHAIGKNNHEEAIAWFEKAEPVLATAAPREPAETALRGEWLVSMGVSYWSVGQKARAVDLTEKGTELLEIAVQKKAARSEQLVVPYNNLAAMHTQLGDAPTAKRYTELAHRIEQEEIRR